MTEGVPRRINVFCDRILLFGYLEEIKLFTQEHIKIVADELADEITSPIKSERHEEVNSYLNELKNNFVPHEENALFKSDPVSTISQPVSKLVKKAPETLASDFVDIEETIRNFERRVEGEIAAFKQSLDKKY